MIKSGTHTLKDLQTDPKIWDFNEIADLYRGITRTDHCLGVKKLSPSMIARSAGKRVCPSFLKAEQATPWKETRATVLGKLVHKALELYVKGTPVTAMVDLAAKDQRVMKAANQIRDLHNIDDLEPEAYAMAVQGVKFLHGATLDKGSTFCESFRHVGYGEDGPQINYAIDLITGPQRSPSTSKKVIVDWKTGRETLENLKQMKAYLLAEFLRTGIPAAKVALVYLTPASFKTVSLSPSIDDLHESVKDINDTAELQANMLETSIEDLPKLESLSCRWCPVTDCDYNRATT